MASCLNYVISAGEGDSHVDFRINKVNDLGWIQEVPDHSIEQLQQIGALMEPEIRKVTGSSVSPEIQTTLIQLFENVQDRCLSILSQYGSDVESLRTSVKAKIGQLKIENNAIKLHQACYDFWDDEISAIAVEMIRRSTSLGGQSPGATMSPVIAMLRQDPTIAGLYAGVIQRLQDTKKGLKTLP